MPFRVDYTVGRKKKLNSPRKENAQKRREVSYGNGDIDFEDRKPGS